MLIERPIKNAPPRRHPPSPPSAPSPTSRWHPKGGIRCHGRSPHPTYPFAMSMSHLVWREEIS
jgi:hypothetical protein